LLNRRGIRDKRKDGREDRRGDRRGKMRTAVYRETLGKAHRGT
jgi:hypothetical protein